MLGENCHFLSDHCTLTMDLSENWDHLFQLRVGPYFAILHSRNV